MNEDRGNAFGVSDLALPGSSLRQRVAVCLVALTLLALALPPLAFAGRDQPAIRDLHALGAAWWVFAEFATAFLLFASFYASGVVVYVMVGAIYLTIALLSLPYLAYLPSFVVERPLSLAEQQIAPTLWALRTLVFGALVAAATFIDPRARMRVVAQGRAAQALGLAILTASVLAIVLATVAIGLDRVFPVFERYGEMTPAYSSALAPGISLALVLIVALLIGGLRRASALQLWLLVVLGANAFSAALLATSPSLYTPAWYASTLERIAGASVLLVVMFLDVAATLRRLAQSARFDPLTGLNNRRAFDDYVAWAIADCEERGASIGLLVVDIDLFKSFNDRYGHAAGDDAMRDVANSLLAQLRGPSDMVSRVGGEEFVVLLVGADSEGAYLAGERVRAAIEELQIPNDGSPSRRLTVSVGAAAGQARELDRLGLFKAADGALYLAKTSGRNRTVLAKNVPTRRVAFLRERANAPSPQSRVKRR